MRVSLPTFRLHPHEPHRPALGFLLRLAAHQIRDFHRPTVEDDRHLLQARGLLSADSRPQLSPETSDLGQTEGVGLHLGLPPPPSRIWCLDQSIQVFEPYHELVTLLPDHAPKGLVIEGTI